MTNWVENRRQEAFADYSRYLAMGLHLRAGSSYDYTTYGGSIRASYPNFVGKLAMVKRFMAIGTKFDSEEFELFLFANYRLGFDVGYIPLMPCIKRYKDWKIKFGDRSNFIRRCAHQMKCHIPKYDCHTTIDTLMDLIDFDEDFMIEPIIAILHIRPELLLLIPDRIKDNIFYQLTWNKMIKIRQLYYHFNIL